MHMINKGQVEEISKKDVLGQKKFALVSLWDCSSLKLDNLRVIMSFSTFSDRTEFLVLCQLFSSIYYAY